MALGNLNIGAYKQMAATANVCARSGAVLGIFCSSSSSGTVALYNSATTTTTDKIVDTVTLIAGTFHQIPVAFDAGLYIVVGGTTQFTVVYA